MATRYDKGIRWLAVCSLFGALLACGLERQSAESERSQNRELRKQLNELEARVTELTNAKEELAKRSTTSTTIANRQEAPASYTNEMEILRLRGEVSRLGLREREAKQSDIDRMQAAQSKIPTAELELQRLTNLYSEGLISTSEIDDARYKLELLKALARGDADEVTQVKLRHAEEEVAKAAELRQQSLISVTEYEEIIRKAESLKTQK